MEWNPSIIYGTLEKDGWIKPKKDWHSDCLIGIIKEHQFNEMFGIGYLESYLSNQIRYGIISRQEALLKMEENNNTNIDIDEVLGLLM